MTHTIIKPQYLERTAYVYLRQSSPGQVRNHREGRQRQPAMTERVAALGWVATKIVTLDGDSGQSGSSQHGRDDFQTMLEAIVTGRVGLIAASELSRLVRDNQDWSQVVRLCRFKNVLLADEHRLYDPADAQDRMVLGIQGAFNEFELSMIIDRMQQSQRQKAERGEQWDVFLENHHPAYITLQEWERNVEKIAANASVRGALTKGAAGRGESLMAGLLRCRRCGHRLHASYSSRGVRYVCRTGSLQRTAQSTTCLAFAGTGLEALLAEEILEVVGPAGVAAAERAGERLSQEHQQRRQLLIDRLQTARDAEQRAAREYKQTDATYTAVRQALGAEWETALARVAEAELRLAEFDQRQPVVPTSSQREQLAHLSDDLRRVWNHPRATGNMKKQLVRVLIQEIVVDIDEKRDEVLLVVHWSGGHHTTLREARRRRRGKLPAAELKSVIDTLRKVMPDESIAAALNREGIRSSVGGTWTRQRVENFRKGARIVAFRQELKASSGWLIQAEAATRLGISPMSVHRLVKHGILSAEQPHPGLPMIISSSELDREEVQSAVLRLKSGHSRPLPDDPRQLAMF